MKIAIDARFYGNGHTGLGRYTTNVLKFLPKYLQGQALQVLLRNAEYDNFPAGKNIEKIHAEIPHYSLAEQLKLPALLSSISSDLLYTFHFNTPIFSKIPTIVTVHDLIKSHFTGRDTTTRDPWFYSLKRAGYNQVIKRTLSHASDIIVPSNTVKNDILAAFPAVKPERIFPIAEAPDSVFRDSSTSVGMTSSRAKSRDLGLPNKYILFVGNAYPHKNLGVLLKAMQQLPDQELVIVAKQSPFLSRILAPYDQTRIHLLSNLTDKELVAVYRQAQVLVTPSLMEGYGLVGLEALMVGTPVIASNIPVYREVYGNKVTYFNPNSVDDLVKIIKNSNFEFRVSNFIYTRTWSDVAHDIAEVIHARCASL